MQMSFYYPHDYTMATKLLTDSIKYDFEEYAMERGIPKLVDPLPYYHKPLFLDGNNKSNTCNKNSSSTSRNGASSGNDAEKEHNDNKSPTYVLKSAKHDRRLRTVVCRHWLQGLCMKGTACEFLHQYDTSKMPYCLHKTKDNCIDAMTTTCPFRHYDSDNESSTSSSTHDDNANVEYGSDAAVGGCHFYKQGFCVHGKHCRYKHVQHGLDNLPAVSNFTLGVGRDTNTKNEGSHGRRHRHHAYNDDTFRQQTETRGKVVVVHDEEGASRPNKRLRTNVSFTPSSLPATLIS